MLAAVAAAALIAAVASAASKHPAVSMTDRGPAFCSAADVHQIASDFVDAFNRGDREELSLLLVRIRFQWYAVNSTRQTDPYSHIEYTRAGALRYFADRHALGERLELQKFLYAGFNAAWGHFDFHVRRKSPDLRQGRWVNYAGAGTVSCLKGPVGLGRWTMTQIT
jgi:hypothetical protein